MSKQIFKRDFKINELFSDIKMTAKQQQTKSSLEFFDSIPCKDEDDIIDVRDYFEHKFDNLYYVDKHFYVDNGVQYKRLHINFNIYGRAFVYARDVNGVRVHIDYVKFKKLYDIRTAFGVETKVKVADDFDYNQPCEFVEVAPEASLEPAEDKNVKDKAIDEPTKLHRRQACPNKAFRPKGVRTKEEDEWWRMKFRRDKERRECLKAKDVNEEVNEDFNDDD